MESEVWSWLGNLMVPTGLAWAVAVLWLLRDIKRGTDRLLAMHERPDEYGFGTIRMGQVMDNLDHTMHALLHYVRWHAEQSTGKKPPPPVPSDNRY